LEVTASDIDVEVVAYMDEGALDVRQALDLVLESQCDVMRLHHSHVSGQDDLHFHIDCVSGRMECRVLPASHSTGARVSKRWCAAVSDCTAAHWGTKAQRGLTARAKVIHTSAVDMESRVVLGGDLLDLSSPMIVQTQVSSHGQYA